MTTAAHPTTRPASALAWRLPIVALVGSVISWTAAVLAYLSLWGLGLAEREGASSGFLTVYGVVVACVLLVALAGIGLVSRALLGRAWWLGLPTVAVGPLVLAAQVGLL